ncbi:zinc finger domain protein [Penicillium malachiteum]|uniref:zinc finger domain protein n=1 Tax=Penicillium malachiteum TaxID=1324776 RepID=UPI00254774B3|nr:zinc finger domain protein [Penicillium malachiteum]KAJ5714845.1 zinc finger domain protein [Penicillium malachiteum]
MERSFYTFEVYCSLFGQSETPLPLDDELETFFKRFAPWENEQLACVHDFLVDELEPAFKEVAAHDVKFGDLSIPWAENDNSWLQGYVCLAWAQISRTSDHCFQSRRTAPSARRTPFTRQQWSGLIECLLDSNELYPEETNELDEQAMVKLRHLPSQYNSFDPNPGPAEIWFQAQEGDDSGQYVAAPPHRTSRKIGYVMMDASRKQDMARFDGPQKSMAWDTFDDEKVAQEYSQQLRSFEGHNEALALVNVNLSTPGSVSGENGVGAGCGSNELQKKEDLRRAKELVNLHYEVKSRHANGKVDDGLQKAREDVAEVFRELS